MNFDIEKYKEKIKNDPSLMYEGKEECFNFIKDKGLFVPNFQKSKLLLSKLLEKTEPVFNKNPEKIFKMWGKEYNFNLFDEDEIQNTFVVPYKEALEEIENIKNGGNKKTFDKIVRLIMFLPIISLIIITILLIVNIEISGKTLFKTLAWSSGIAVIVWLLYKSYDFFPQNTEVAKQKELEQSENFFKTYKNKFVSKVIAITKNIEKSDEFKYICNLLFCMNNSFPFINNLKETRFNFIWFKEGSTPIDKMKSLENAYIYLDRYEKYMKDVVKPSFEYNHVETIENLKHFTVELVKYNDLISKTDKAIKRVEDKTNKMYEDLSDQIANVDGRTIIYEIKR